jgi:hypothetical protein
MYPTAIVVLVEMQKSLYDTDQVTCERGLGTASGIAFATRELESNTTRGNSTKAHAIEDISHLSGGLHSTGDNSTSSNIELEAENVSRRSIPGKDVAQEPGC